MEKEERLCPECGGPVDEDGDGESCCTYAPACDECGGSTCDQSC